jgi:hypothetical protein
MRLIVRRHSLAVVPESPTDEVYLEEVLGLMKDGDSVRFTRHNAVVIPSKWGWAEAVKETIRRPKRMKRKD